MTVMKKSEILTTLIDHFFSFDAEKGNLEEYSFDEFIGYLNSKSEYRELEMREISGDNDMQTESLTVGYIGLGLMGKSIARNILKGGFQLEVHNRSRAAAEELAAEGAR